MPPRALLSTSRRRTTAVAACLALGAAAIGTATYANAANGNATCAPGSAVLTSAIAINVGGPAISEAGRDWQADQYGTGGHTWTNTNPAPIAGSNAQTVYHSERAGSEVAYEIPLPNGTYLVRLHLAEIYWNAPGGEARPGTHRIADYTIEGIPVLTEYDPAADTGAPMRAAIKGFETTIADGTLSITGKASLDMAQLAGIQAFRLSACTGGAAPIAEPSAEPSTEPSTPVGTTEPAPVAPTTTASPSAPAAPVAGAPAWPLKVSSNKHYLADSSGRPFFMVADTVWGMFQNVDVANAKKYIDIRKSQGFNTVMSNFFFHSYDQDTPRGKPFNAGITSPNESWWKGVDEIVSYAQSQGMTMYVGPMWWRTHGGLDGGNTPSNADLTAYGQFLGKRYANAKNVIWFIGGDDDNEKFYGPSDALAQGLVGAAPGAILSYHNQDNAPAMQSRSWHSFYSFQWNSNSEPWPYDLVKEHRGWSPTKPVLDMEPAYDPSTCCGSDRNTTAQKNRRSGWWAALAGSMGVVYGGPRSVWNLGGESGGQLPTADLNRPAAKETAVVGKVLSQYNWASLVPDTGATVVTGDRGSGDSYVTAGASADGKLIIAYTPTKRSLSVDLSKLSGPGTATWINPSTGQAAGAAQAVSNSGTKTFSSPLGEDAVLVIRAG